MNLVFCYIENLLVDNFMKGILMLRLLDDENLENVLVNISLVRLVI